MTVTLRPYQLTAVDGVVLSLLRNPILVAPTGGGKTAMGADLVTRLQGRALWTVHSRELVHQAYSAINKVEPGKVGVIMGREPPNMFAKYQVASIQTLARREIPECDVIFVDECHHAPSDSYAFLFEQGVPVVGLTATPFRLDGKPLGGLFGEIVVAAHVDDLVQQGYLLEPRVFSHTLDMTGVQRRGGDFNKRQMAQAVREKMVVGDIVQEWMAKAHGRKTVCFATDVAHSIEIVAAFREANIRAEHIDGTMLTDDRDAILERLKTGETTIVSNVKILTEGWDLPALECGIFARPTDSLSLHLQMVGRIMRPSEGKARPIALDHAGNFIRHGSPLRRLHYSLEGEVRPAPSSEQLDARRCAECGYFYARAMTACPECGAEVEIQSREINRGPEGAGELSEFDGDTYNVRLAFWCAKEEERIESDYAEGWSLHAYHDRFGDWPLIDAERNLLDPGDKSAENKQRVYDAFAQVADVKGYKEGWVRYRYKDVFGVWPRGIKTRPLPERKLPTWSVADGVTA